MIPTVSPVKWARRVVAGAICAVCLVASASAEILVKSGEKIAFLGDSITQGGWQSPQGYVKLVMSGLAANGVQAEAVPAGISGHKSNDMLARLDRDVIAKKPQWMTLSCGVNDVWHGKKGVPLNDAAAAVKERMMRKSPSAAPTRKTSRRSWRRRRPRGSRWSCSRPR